MRYRDPDTGHFISEAEWQRRQAELDLPEEEEGWDYEFDEEEYYTPE